MAKIYKRKDTKKVSYYAHFTVRGERHRVRLEAQNLEQAKKIAAEIEYEVLAGKYKFLQHLKPVTLRELADRYIEYAKSNKRSWQRDLVSLKNLLNMEIDNKKLGDYPVDSIKVVHIQKYQIRRRRELDKKYEGRGIAEEDRTFASVNRELSCLRHIFNIGIEWELLTKNPVVSKAIKFDKEKSRTRTLEDDEFFRLLKACTGQLYQIVIVALNTGMRRGEILGLKWEDIKLDQGKIEVKHTKNDEDRVIPISAFLKCLLESMPHRSGYLFLNRQKAKMSSIKTAWGNVIRKAGIEDFHFHDLRHTVATRLARAKVTESVIAMILGHKRSTITSRYINPHWVEMVEAVVVLSDLCHRFVTDETEPEADEPTNNQTNNGLDEAFSA